MVAGFLRASETRGRDIHRVIVMLCIVVYRFSALAFTDCALEIPAAPGVLPGHTDAAA